MIPSAASSDTLTRGEVELKYYIEENLDQAIGVCVNATWQAAIRLTQDEMAAYQDWTLTKIKVAYNADEGCPFVDIRIYIYDIGTETTPGSLLVSDTACRLNSSGVHTIPLLTPVNLSGHEELWVSVEWTENTMGYYAWIDTLSGPHVPNKSDFCKLGTSWSQLHVLLPEVDGRWGIGAIIEGTYRTELSIAGIRGPLGVQAIVSNTGVYEAENVEWTIAARGGFFKRVNASSMGSTPLLNGGASIPILLPPFLGLGKISIVITAQAANADKISVTKSAFLIGRFALRIT
jgi:hypothetical protein